MLVKTKSRLRNWKTNGVISVEARAQLVPYRRQPLGMPCSDLWGLDTFYQYEGKYG